MRVLLINTVPTGKNGITNVIFNYLKAVKAEGVIFDVLCINEPERIYRECVEAKGGRMYVLPRSSRRLARYWEAVRETVKRNRYDVVHIHGNSHTVVLELSAARAAGCVVGMVHAHNTTCNHVVVHKILTPLFNSLCTHRLACGEAAGRFMFGKHPFRVVNNGVDTSQYAYNDTCRKLIRERLHWQDCKVIGHVGYFSEVKNHKFLVEVFGRLHVRDQRYRLLLIGDGKLRADVEAQINEAGLTDAVHITGNIDNVNDYLNAMDMVVMPSLFEGLPLTLIEQQANGLQCVVADTITREADKTGNLTFLPLSLPPEEWAARIDAIGYNHSRSECSRQAIEMIAAAGYSINEEAEKLGRYYLGIIKNNQ